MYIYIYFYNTHPYIHIYIHKAKSPLLLLGTDIILEGRLWGLYEYAWGMSMYEYTMNNMYPLALYATLHGYLQDYATLFYGMGLALHGQSCCFDTEKNTIWADEKGRRNGM